MRTLLANRPSARNQELVQQTMQRYREQNETDVGRKVTALEQENRKFRETNPLGKVSCSCPTKQFRKSNKRRRDTC